MRGKIFVFFIVCWFVSTSVFSRSPIRSWSTDMYNQPNIKPQEEGTMLRFPVGAVTRDGDEITSDGYKNFAIEKQAWTDFRPDGFKYNSALTPSNPIEKNENSLKNGEYFYNVYCVVCHGEDGTANMPVGKLRGSPAIKGLIPKLSEGYLYVRITYGGPTEVSMPPFGYSTTEKERWEIVNYLKNTFK